MSASPPPAAAEPEQDVAVVPIEGAEGEPTEEVVDETIDEDPSAPKEPVDEAGKTDTAEKPAEESAGGRDDAGGTEGSGSESESDPESADARVAVSGSLVMVQQEAPSTGEAGEAADEHSGHAVHEGELDVFYLLETADGLLLALDESADEVIGKDPLPGARFAGELAVPAPVVQKLARSGKVAKGTRKGEKLATGSPAAAAALAALTEEDEPVEVLSGEVVPSSTASASSGASEHAIYAAVISNRGTQPTDSAINGVMTQAADYWQGQSEEVLTMTHAETKRYAATAATTANLCGYGSETAYSQVVLEAQQQFPGVGFGMNSGNHLVVVVPESCAGTKTGLGDVGLGFANGGRLLATGYTGGPATGSTKFRHVTTHEIGHNLGFHHAYGFYCPPDTYCRNVEYGDLYSVMGYTTPDPGLPALNTSARVFQGITQPGEITEVGVASARTVTLQPRTASSGQRAAKVTDSDGTVYYVEYRSGTGADDGAYSVNYTGSHLKLAGGLVNAYFASGVTVLKQDPLCSTTSNCQLRTYLVANHIENERQNGSYLPGQAFRSSVAGSNLKIFVTSIGDGEATLRILGPSAAAEPDPFVPSDFETTPVPSLTGTTAMGVTQVGETLTAHAGQWAPEPDALSYQWRRDGSPIAGATDSTYPVVADDLGKRVSVAVTGSKTGYNSATKVSTEIDIEAGELSSSIPDVEGTPKVGNTLTAVPGDWDPAPVNLSYQWRRADSNGTNRVDIAGATDSTYTPVAADVGKRVSVAVTGTKPGYNTVVRADLGTVVREADTTPEPPPVQYFKDVPLSHKFAKEINWMYVGGYSTGTKVGNDRYYYPKDGVSREAMAAFLYRLESPAGYTPPSSSPFSDVSTSHRFYKEIAWMYDSGISTGTKQPSGKPKYGPTDIVSREAMAAFLYRLEGGGVQPPATSPFSDVAKTDKFYREIAWMYTSGLSTGTKQPSGKPKYGPKDDVSREAMAAFLYRLDDSRTSE